MALLRASAALLRAEAYYVPSRRYHKPRRAHFRLPPCLTSPHLLQRSDYAAAMPASSKGVPRSPLPHLGPAPPSFSQPQGAPHPQHPSAQGLSAAKPHLPQTQILETEQRGSPARGTSLTIAGAGWAGKRKCGSGQSRASFPFARSAAAVSARTSGLYHQRSERGRRRLRTFGPSEVFPLGLSW